MEKVALCGVVSSVLLVGLGYKIAPIIWQEPKYKNKSTKQTQSQSALELVNRNEEESATELTEAERHFRNRKPPDLWNTVILFPDMDPQNENSPTNQLISYFKNARVSLRMCVYITSYQPLEDIIIAKKEEGLLIQVITDCDQMREEGQNWGMIRFKHKGIPVRFKDKRGELMHNKFVIFDEEAVLTGSLNWTTQAFQGNAENILVTTSENIVSSYKTQFNKLWGEAK